MIKSLACLLKLAFLIVMLITTSTLYAQLNQKKVSGIYTDFSGGWASRESPGVNATVVNTSHNLLAFTYDGITYSTGANNDLLQEKGITTSAGNYKAMPIASLGGTVTSAGAIYLLMPAADDGNAANFVAPYPTLGIKDVLTDGLNGLNIGTGVTNLPINAVLTYNINAISINALNDPRPVIMCTQIAATGGGKDKLYFVNSSNEIVGDTIKVDWNSSMTPIIGKHSCDLYTLSVGAANSSTVSGAADNAQPKEIRMAAFKLSDFNISAIHLSSIYKLIVTPGGASDPGFVAYNSDILTSYATLPVVFSNVQGVLKNDEAYVSWQTSMENNSDRFVVERGTDGQSFHMVGAVKAAGNSNQLINYSFTDKTLVNGGAYYRIKQYDLDGKSTVSKTVQISSVGSLTGVSVRAVASAGTLLIKHPAVSDRAFVQVISMSGSVVAQQQIVSGTFETSIAMRSFTAGVYRLIITDGDKRITKQLFLN